MIVKCLSVRNPLSYLLCIGVKNVENRNYILPVNEWVYIQSSGEPVDAIIPDDLPAPIGKELSKWLKTADENGILKSMPLKFENELYDIMSFQLEKNKSDSILESQAIIGRVKFGTCVDKDFSLWCDKNAKYRYEVVKAELLPSPIRWVKGRQSGIFQHTIR